MIRINERFDELFEQDTYLSLKNWLFSYQLRCRHLRPLLAGSDQERLLDLGCGISPIAPPGPNVIYADISSQAMRYLSLQHPEASFVVADLTHLPFRSDAVSHIVCSEVLEHIEDDAQAMQEISRVARDGALLAISVPVHPYYYTFDDSYVGHFRRYRLGELTDALKARGFADIRVRKVAGVLEKLATYVMVRSFALLSKMGSGRSGLNRGRPWWSWPYKVGNTAWSYVCWLESKITPLAATTIVSVQCRKAAARQQEPASTSFKEAGAQKAETTDAGSTVGGSE